MVQKQLLEILHNHLQNPSKNIIDAMYFNTVFRMRVCVSKLVGGFNPFEKYYSNWSISPSRDENKKMF